MFANAPAPACGALSKNGHVLPLRVYYEDTDFSGLVYHASYLRFFERGRTELLRALGFDQNLLHRTVPPAIFVVRRISVEFLSPARMDDMLIVETSPIESRAASVELAQKIWRDDRVLCEARALIVCVSGERPRRIPDALRDAFEALAGGQDPL